MGAGSVGKHTTAKPLVDEPAAFVFHGRTLRLFFITLLRDGAAAVMEHRQRETCRPTKFNSSG